MPTKGVLLGTVTQTHFLLSVIARMTAWTLRGRPTTVALPASSTTTQSDELERSAGRYGGVLARRLPLQQPVAFRHSFTAWEVRTARTEATS